MKKSGYIYLIHAKGTSRYKIGLTTRTVQERLAELNSSQSAFPLELIASAKFQNVHETEKYLHQRYRLCRVHGEWFEFSKRELQAAIKDIQGVESGFSFSWWFLAIALVFALAYCQNQQQLDPPQPSDFQRQATEK
jgi:hypothetical protein